MSHWIRITALLALSLVLGGSQCGEDEGVPLEVLQRDVAPPFDYALYCDAQGRLTGRNSDVLLAHRSEHLERVFADAQRGDARAQVLFGQLEAQVAASGATLADHALSLGCASLPTCTVRWELLDEFIPSREAGGMRLRQVLATNFDRTARLKGVQNAVITAAMSVLLVGSVLEKAEASAAGAEARTLSRGSALGARLAEGLPLEEAAALEARLAEAEALETGVRHPARLEVLARHRPSANQPPAGVAPHDGRWLDYVAYWERRYEELAGTRQPPPGTLPAKPPLVWSSYTTFRGRFKRALDFQQNVAREIRSDAGLARTERHWLRGLEQPLVLENVGLAHEGSAGLTYVDQLVVDEASLGTGQRPAVHTFSNKQRDLSAMSENAAKGQLRADIREAWTKYGGTVEVRRPGHPLFGRKVTVSRVHLVYDEEGLTPKLKKMLTNEAEKLDTELHFHARR